MAPRRPLHETEVFLNVPFDRRYQPLFVALIAGLVALRRAPHCVLEIPDGGAGRLRRIVDLLSQCGASVHDLSRVSLSGPARVPRVNMPFELGLACAVARLGHRHEYFILEEKPHRLEHSLNDLNGHDPRIHDGTVDGVLRALSDCFGTRGIQPSPARVRRLHDIVLQRAHEVRRQTGAADLFTPTLFRRTTLIAVHVAQNMELIP